MFVINFAHPLTAQQIKQIENLTGRTVERLIEIGSQVDLQQPLAPQVSMLVDRCELSPTDWQTLPIVVNPPSLNFSAAILMAELHGRMGYFPPIVVLRRINAIPPAFEVGEVVSLQAVQDKARTKR